jgi:two-component system sporulation sensor kinase A
VGSLGGAIAHALNNPLATIRGFAEVIKRRFGDVERIGYFADKIITNSDRMRGTIDELRALSKPQHRDGAHGRVDLKDVLESTLGIMDEQCKMHNIDVQCDLGKHSFCLCWPIPAMLLRSYQQNKSVRSSSRAR